MKVRTIASLVGLLVIIYGAVPLIAAATKAPDICCSDSSECPPTMGCVVGDGGCSSEAGGYCVPIQN